MGRFGEFYMGLLGFWGDLGIRVLFFVKLDRGVGFISGQDQLCVCIVYLYVCVLLYME